MTSGRTSPIILVANNPLGHHLLTSQLLELYKGLDPGVEVILICNGVMGTGAAIVPPSIKMVSFSTPWGGPIDYINLIRTLIAARWRYPNAAYHLRGFVAGMAFFLSRLGLVRHVRYIYDPRGAFFIEWWESGRSRAIGCLFRWIESRLVRSSVATIVTSERFARFYRRLFGSSADILTIYNTTGFSPREGNRWPQSSDKLRVVYLGTFNHWHDMNELYRVMDEVARQLGPERVELSVYTLPRFHERVNEKFRQIGCASLTVEYVSYHDIPNVLADKHVGISVVRPTISSRIASPIKVSDYIALGLVPLINTGIGDFDRHFKAFGSAILYEFGGPIDLSGLGEVNTSSNGRIYDLVSITQACSKLAPAVERLRNG